MRKIVLGFLLLVGVTVFGVPGKKNDTKCQKMRRVNHIAPFSKAIGFRSFFTSDQTVFTPYCKNPIVIERQRERLFGAHRSKCAFYTRLCALCVDQFEGIERSVKAKVPAEQIDDAAFWLLNFVEDQQLPEVHQECCASQFRTVLSDIEAFLGERIPN